MEMRKKVNQQPLSKAIIPNVLTGLRIAGGIALIFLPLMRTAFYVVYILCGVSDVLDGYLARRFKTASPFGARLDSVADLTFYSILILRLLPKLRQRLPDWIWYGVALVLAIRLCGYLIAAIRFKKFASLHSYANKLTGAGVFGVALAMGFPWLTTYCAVVLVIGLFSSTQEVIYHLRAQSE